MPDQWAIVELMGHVRLAGLLTEEEHFGTKLGRIDVPRTEPCDCGNGQGLELLKKVPCGKCSGTGRLDKFLTQLFGGASVYRITPVTEEVARQAAAAAPAPVGTWGFPKQLTAARASHDDDYEDRGDEPSDLEP